MSSNERRFNDLLKSAIDKYGMALKAKSPKNQIKHANACMKNMNAAIRLIEIIGNKDKLPYLYEYLSLSEALIAKAYIADKNFLDSVNHFQIALKYNKQTLKNQETTIRNLFIYEELMKIAILQKNWRLADPYAQKLVISGKKLNQKFSDYLQYLVMAKEVFIESKNLDWINKTYKSLLKLCKKEAKNLSKAEIGFVFKDYARYCQIVLKKEKKAQSFYKKAQELFVSTGNKGEVEAIKKLMMGE